MPTVVARDPAIFGLAEFGHSRTGVYPSKWEELLCAMGGAYRALTHRIYSAPTADATTRQRPAVFTDESINGLLVESGGSVPPFASALGVRMRLNALVVTIDPCAVKDGIFDSLTRHEWEVGAWERFNDPQVYYDGSGNELVSLAFYAVHLKVVDATSQTMGAV